MNSFFYKVTLCLGLLALSQHSFAAVKCNNVGTSGVEFSPQIGGSIYAGEDVPVGTVLYQVRGGREYFSLSFQPVFVCYDSITNELTKNIELLEEKVVVSQPQGAPFSFPESPVSGKIYNTNVPGIGVALVHGATGNTSITTSSVTESASLYRSTNNWHVPVFYISAVLIKTGPVANGSVVLGSSFPVVRSHLKNPEITGALPLYNAGRASFSGSLTVQSSTCQPVNKTVYLGAHKSKNFEGVGTTTNWADASIELKNCPVFSGYYQRSGYQISTNGGKPEGGTRTGNALSVSLTPAYGTLDDNLGIMKIKTTNNSAQGLGIQIARGTTAVSQAFSFSKNEVFFPGNSAGSNISLNFVARYYQTEDKVTPGAADGSMTYTINYH